MPRTSTWLCAPRADRAAIDTGTASPEVTGGAAFALLRKDSMDDNQKLHLLAEEIMLTGNVSALGVRAGGALGSSVSDLRAGGRM